MTPDEIKQLRLAAAHTQAEAAETIHRTTRNWQQFESGDRSCDPALIELYQLKTHQHPDYTLVKKPAPDTE